MSSLVAMLLMCECLSHRALTPVSIIGSGIEAGDDRDRLVDKEYAALRGEWQGTSVDKSGRVHEEGTWIFLGGQFALKRDCVVYEQGQYKIDPAAKPKAIDITFGSGPAKGKALPGIYELNDEQLKICIVAPTLADPDKHARPKEFPKTATEQLRLFILKREK